MIPRDILDETLYALALRVRWYDTRRLEPPRGALEALAHFAKIAGVDPESLRR